MSLKRLFTACAVLLSLYSPAQTCFNITNRTNGNGNPGTCGGPACSGNAKTGHIDVDFSGACPGVIPSLQLLAVTSGSLPNPFCFDPGNCISPGTVRYCFRGTNLPSSGFMTLRLTQGATIWSCTYDVNGGSGLLILPVKISALEAKMQQQQVLVKWNTEQEFNNDEFQIERSADERTFAKIGAVKGKGNSNTVQQYSFTDDHPVKGVSFYRLKQMDIDGHFTYSTIKRVDNRIQGLEVKQIFPNPASTEINLQLMADETAVINARFFNLAGNQVLSANKKLIKGEQSWHIVLPKLAGGIYEMIISNDKGDILSEKIMVN